MNLIDSHVLIWWWIAPTKLSRQVRETLGSRRSEVFVSAATAWEIATKQRLGTLSLPQAILDAFEQEVLSEEWTFLPIDVRAACVAGGLPWEHRDPFDRVLAAQAMNEGFVLIPVTLRLPVCLGSRLSGNERCQSRRRVYRPVTCF